MALRKFGRMMRHLICCYVVCQRKSIDYSLQMMHSIIECLHELRVPPESRFVAQREQRNFGQVVSGKADRGLFRRAKALIFPW